MYFLVVDDSRVARQRVCEYLKELDFKVIAEAVDGFDAIEKFKKLRPDVVAIDLEMPNMKGIEASKRILDINPNTDIILITSIIDKKEVVNALKVGIKKVINKPFTKNQLATVIQDLKKAKQ